LSEADEVLLDGGWTGGVRDEALRIDVQGFEGLAEGSACGVIAGNAEGGDCAAERGEVEADIGSAAGVVGAGADVEDGDGGIGGEAFGIAVDLLVEHEVADDQGAERLPVGQVMKEGGGHGGV
jgi:hypothetical protein